MQRRALFGTVQQIEAMPAHVDRQSAKTSRRSSILSKFFQCIVAICFAISMESRAASAQSAEGFLGWQQGSTYYPTAREACKAQFDDFALGGSQRFIGANIHEDDPNIAGCSWTFFGFLCSGALSCTNSHPSTVSFHCATGYTRVLGTYCVKDPVPERPCNCNSGSSISPTVGNPIAVLTGTKLVRATDFATSDGKFTISRSYRSIPFGLSATATLMPLGLAGNWNFDFSYELKLGLFSGSPSAPNAKVAVLAPDGTAYDFKLLSDGTWAADTTTGAYFAHKDLKLEYLGTLPADLSTIRSSSSQWRLTDRNDTVWTFQTFARPSTTVFHTARPISRVERDGYRWDFTYRSDTSLEKIIDSYGRQATVNWSMFHLATNNTPPANALPYPEAIKSIDLPDGTSIRYTFDPAATVAPPSTSYVERLIKVERLNSSATVIDSTTYTYGDARHPRAITAIIDDRGVQTATYTYDARGRALSTAGGGGANSYSVEYTETSTERSRRVTNPLGKTAVFHFTQFGAGDFRLTQIEGEASANCATRALAFTYGPDNFIATEVDEEGRTTSFIRDSLGRPTAVTEAYGTPLARTTNYTWDASFNLPTIIARPGLTETRTYNASGQLTNVTQTDTTTITSPYATNGRTRSWAYDWAPNGLLNSVDGPLPGDGDVVRFTYDAAGYLQTRTDEVSNVTQVTVRDARGAPLTVQDENGTQTVITYDFVGRPLTMTINPGASQARYVMEYDAAGNLKKLIMPMGAFLSYTYDDANRVTRIDNDRGEHQAFVLNGLGQSTSDVTKDASATITRQQSQVFDELGRIIQSVGAGGQTTAFQYDRTDNVVQMTDGRSKQWGTGWDALNRAVTQTDPTAAQQQLEYAANDELTEYKDGRNVTTSRIVDGFGQTIFENSPDRGPRTYFYDEAGRLTRIEAPDDPASGTTDQTAHYFYDSTASGNVGTGRLTMAIDQSGSSAFTYDAQGRLTANQKLIQGQSYQLAYGYDANGALTSIIYPSGHVITYVRATDGKVTAVRAQASASATTSNLAASIIYAPFGPLKALTYGNGLALTRGYDQNYWLTGITLTGGGSLLLDLAYTRDGNGNVAAVTDNASTGRAASFTYTDDDRLASATGLWGSDAYTWDASGNRTRVDRTLSGSTLSDVATITPASNRLAEIRDGSGVLAKAFTLSADGDMVAQAVSGGPAYDYVYDPAGRLASLKIGGAEVASYLYDHAGHRVVRTIPTASPTTIHYIYGPDGHVLAEHDGATGALIREYVWLGDMPLAQVSGLVGTPQYAYVHTGQLNEPLMVTDAAQAKLWDVAMDPWGNALPLSTPTIAQDLRLPGQSLQSESGLFQNWMRDYDPTLGRYIQADPIGLAGGGNVFAYAEGNPISKIDPVGLDVLVIIGDSTGMKVWDGQNPLGHAAVGLTDCGCVYSFGTEDPLGTSLRDYLKNQSKYRSSTIYRIATTTEQDRIIRRELLKHKGKPLPDPTSDPKAAWNDTCATRIRDALLKAGVWLPPVTRMSPFPSDLELGARMMSNRITRVPQVPKVGGGDGW
jgi:RHS repeat-associated protein